MGCSLISFFFYHFMGRIGHFSQKTGIINKRGVFTKQDHGARLFLQDKLLWCHYYQAVQITNVLYDFKASISKLDWLGMYIHSIWQMYVI